jgi:hypothetical protein
MIPTFQTSSRGRMLMIPMLALILATSPSRGAFEVIDRNGRIEIHDAGKPVFGWQYELIKNAVGGEEFAGSAFIHPLATPAGFQMTCIQPQDHLHHYGVWWPWKMLTVEGESYITWEMQAGKGRHIGVSASVESQSADEVVLQVENRSEIKKGEGYQPATKERATLRFSRMGKVAYLLDITIRDEAVVDAGVEVTRYRYSGFSWRGPGEWNKNNSQMRTSSGKDRDHANGELAHWVTVDGENGEGRATMLMMSAASRNGAPVERLRVWDSSNHNGSPFVNFNPVMKSSIPLMAARTEVSQRRYRLIVADRVITPEEAERLWSSWKK